MERACLLLAEEKNVLPLVRAALKDYKVLEATSIKQAYKLMRESNIDIFVVGINFDDSSSTELIKLIRLDHGYDKTPVVVQRLHASGRPLLLNQILGAMKRVGTINDYLDLYHDPDFGEKIRACVQRALFVARVAGMAQGAVR